jgi:hypothetical protein
MVEKDKVLIHHNLSAHALQCSAPSPYHREDAGPCTSAIGVGPHIIRSEDYVYRAQSLLAKATYVP